MFRNQSAVASVDQRGDTRCVAAHVMSYGGHRMNSFEEKVLLRAVIAEDEHLDLAWALHSGRLVMSGHTTEQSQNESAFDELVAQQLRT